MKNLSFRKKLFLLALVLLLVVNAFVLNHVYRNRSGVPDAQVVLTEREVHLSSRNNHEDNGMSLNLVWRVFSPPHDADYLSYWHCPVWLNAQKLRELGFSLSEKPSTMSYWNNVKKEVFIVLEINSPLFQQELAVKQNDLDKQQQQLQEDPENQKVRDQVQRLISDIKHEKAAGSRLYAVDAGLDGEILRQRYSDRSKYLLFKGIISYYRVEHDGAGEKKAVYRGYISSLNNNQIYVPRNQRIILEKFTRKPKNSQGFPRYKIHLACGRLYEPWLVDVEPIKSD